MKSLSLLIKTKNKRRMAMLQTIQEESGNNRRIVDFHNDAATK
jgi:hypothetical protein